MTKQDYKSPTAARWLIDSHIHLDMVRTFHPDKVSWLQDHLKTMVSWAFATHIGTKAQLIHYLGQQVRDMEHINGARPGSCFFMSGIHPRSIPRDLKPENVADILEPFLNHPLCLGIGEIGLEIATTLEQEIFEAQLELARSGAAGRGRIGVHTPRRNKNNVTDAILDVLRRFADLSSLIVMDHCTEETLPRVLTAKLRAGVTLSPPKTSVEQLPAILRQHPQAPSRIMCNTDSGEEVFVDLITASEIHILGDSEKKALLAGNAADFFGLEIDEAGIVVRGDRP